MTNYGLEFFFETNDKHTTFYASFSSPRPTLPTQQRVKTVARYAGYLGISAVIGVVSLTGVILIHDAFTYNNRHVHRVPANPLTQNVEVLKISLLHGFSLVTKKQKMPSF
jgi:hypothetical protein